MVLPGLPSSTQVYFSSPGDVIIITVIYLKTKLKIMFSNTTCWTQVYTVKHDIVDVRSLMPGLLLAIRKVVRLKVTRKHARVLHPLMYYLLLSNHLSLFSFGFTESGLWPREIPVGTEVFRQSSIKIRVKCYIIMNRSCHPASHMKENTLNIKFRDRMLFPFTVIRIIIFKARTLTNSNDKTIILGPGKIRCSMLMVMDSWILIYFHVSVPTYACTFLVPDHGILKSH